MGLSDRSARGCCMYETLTKKERVKIFSTVCEKELWFMTSSSQPTGVWAAMTSNMSSITRSVSCIRDE